MVDQVAPVVAFLSHESCGVTGKLIEAGGGAIGDFFVSRTRGYQNAQATAEDILDNWNRIVDRTGAAERLPPDSSYYDCMRPKPYVPR